MPKVDVHVALGSTDCKLRRCALLLLFQELYDSSSAGLGYIDNVEACETICHENPTEAKRRESTCACNSLLGTVNGMPRAFYIARTFKAVTEKVVAVDNKATSPMWFIFASIEMIFLPSNLMVDPIELDLFHTFSFDRVT